MRVIRIVAIAFIISLLFIVGCNKTTSPCLPLPNSASYIVNAYDESDSTGGYFNKNIINFLLTESTTSYAGGDNCPDESCSITLKLQNLTPKKVTFSYNLGFVWNNGGSSQAFQGNTITIDSAATLNVGTLSNNCSVVTAPTTTVQLSQISYQ
jgi:hypothetical protein